MKKQKKQLSCLSSKPDKAKAKRSSETGVFVSDDLLSKLACKTDRMTRLQVQQPLRSHEPSSQNQCQYPLCLHFYRFNGFGVFNICRTDDVAFGLKRTDEDKSDTPVPLFKFCCLLRPGAFFPSELRGCVKNPEYDCERKTTLFRRKSVCRKTEHC